VRESPFFLFAISLLYFSFSFCSLQGVFQDLRGYGNIRTLSPFMTENSTGWTFGRGRSRVLKPGRGQNVYQPGLSFPFV